jgi:hypothetical protein
VELDDRRRADELDHYWDAVMRGESPRRPDSMDDLDVAVIARVGEPRISERLDAARHRVRRHILAPTTLASAQGVRTQPSARAEVDRSDRSGPPQSVDRAAPARVHWLPVAIAIAAVLVLAVGIGYYGLGIGRSDNHHRNTIPAVNVQATPTPSSIDETLVDVEIPAEFLPKSYAGASIAHYTVPIGSQSTWTVFQNALLHYIWKGSLTVSADTPMRVQRAGVTGIWETIPSGIEVELEGGDAALMLGMSSSSFSNFGSIPVEMVVWSLSTETPLSSPAPSEWILGDYTLINGPGASPIGLQGRSATLQLRSSVLESGSTLPAPPVDELRLVITWPDNGAGTPVAVFLSRPASGAVENFGKTSTLVFVSTFQIAGSAGTPIIATQEP